MFQSTQRGARLRAQSQNDRPKNKQLPQANKRRTWRDEHEMLLKFYRVLFIKMIFPTNSELTLWYGHPVITCN